MLCSSDDRASGSPCAGCDAAPVTRELAVGVYASVIGELSPVESAVAVERVGDLALVGERHRRGERQRPCSASRKHRSISDGSGVISAVAWRRSARSSGSSSSRSMFLASKPTWRSLPPPSAGASAEQPVGVPHAGPGRCRGSDRRPRSGWSSVVSLRPRATMLAKLGAVMTSGVHVGGAIGGQEVAGPEVDLLDRRLRARLARRRHPSRGRRRGLRRHAGEEVEALERLVGRLRPMRTRRWGGMPRSSPWAMSGVGMRVERCWDRRARPACRGWHRGSTSGLASAPARGVMSIATSGLGLGLRDRRRDVRPAGGGCRCRRRSCRGSRTPRSAKAALRVSKWPWMSTDDDAA